MFSALSSSRLWRAAFTSISSRSGASFSRRLPRAGRGAVTFVAAFVLGSALVLGAGFAAAALAAARFGAGSAVAVFGAALLAFAAGFGVSLAAAALAAARFGAGAAAAVFGAALLALAAGFGVCFSAAALATVVFGAAFGAAAAFGLALALALVAALGFGSAATRRFGLSSAGVGLRAMAASCLYPSVTGAALPP